MEQTDNLLGFSPADAANRALQAVFGIVSFYLSSAKEDIQLNDFAKATIESIEIVNTWPDDANVDTYKSMKLKFKEILKAGTFPLLKGDYERIWKLFVERYDFRTWHLRANLTDVLECFDLSILAKSASRPELYFRRLPLSAEIVLIPADGGVKIEIYIPPRLLVLDMILMLVHAQKEHRKLEEIAAAQKSNLFLDIEWDGRLDAYARQILTLATTICDNVLTEYGYLVEEVLSNTGKVQEAKKLAKLHKRGVTERLKGVPMAWSSTMGTHLPENQTTFHDMINLVQVRNRLVHPDGRVNCWHAFQLSPATGIGWNFSERIKPYLVKPSYGIPESHIGYEFALCRFCVDTTIGIIHDLHRLVYPLDNEAIWLEIPVDEDGQVILDQLIGKEQVLQV